MSVTIKLHTVATFAAGLIAAMIAAFTFQAFRADAVASDEAAFVPITPCRLMDTRANPDFHIGPHATFGAGDAKTIQARGANGDCTIPADAVGLSLNVTALDATAPSFLTIWPDGARPVASSLNPVPGEPPTPNAVTTNLSGSGAFNVYNLAGTVDVIIDINGYYTKASLEALAAQVTALEAGMPVTASNHSDDVSPLPTLPFSVRVLVSTPLTAPGDGKVTVTAGAHLYNMGGEVDSVQCTISTDAQYDVKFGIYPNGSFSSVRVFDVKAGEAATYSLVCGAGIENIGAFNNFISAIYTPAA